MLLVARAIKAVCSLFGYILFGFYFLACALDVLNASALIIKPIPEITTLIIDSFLLSYMSFH